MEDKVEETPLYTDPVELVPPTSTVVALSVEAEEVEDISDPNTTGVESIEEDATALAAISLVDTGDIKEVDAVGNELVACMLVFE